MIVFLVIYIFACYYFMRGVRVHLLAEGKDLKKWARIFAPFYVWHLAGEALMTSQKYHHIVTRRIEAKDNKKKHAEASEMAAMTERIRKEIELKLKATEVKGTEPVPPPVGSGMPWPGRNNGKSSLD